MSQSLAVKYRPQSFEDVTEQSSIIKILEKQIETKRYQNLLLCGPSGCGKTTLGRIFANEVNRGLGQPIEIDAASNSGVDNVRSIIKDAKERSLSGEYKIFIVDEAHSLSNTAWQAFLKCIEETPKYTIFIFCTTDPQKIPATILNRVMRLNLSRISHKGIIDRLSHICKKEDFINYEDTVEYISRICNGGMRDAIAYLEKCATYSSDLSIENAVKVLGDYTYTTYFDLINALIDEDLKKTFDTLNYIFETGDSKLFINQFLNLILEILKYIIFGNLNSGKLPLSLENEVKNCTNFENPLNYFNYVLDKILDLKDSIKGDIDINNTITAAFIQISRLK